MENKTEAPRRWTESTPIKLAVLGLVMLVLMIPVAQVTGLIRERAQRKQEAALEVAGVWGGAQALAGPILAIPYREVIEPTRATPQRTAVAWTGYFLPQAVSWRGTLEPEIRKRGIFEAVVYEARLRVEGSFGPPDLAALGVQEKDEVLWDQAGLMIGMSKLKGLQNLAVLSWAGQPHAFLPGSTHTELLPSGLHAPLKLSSRPLAPPAPAANAAGERIPFAFELVLRGSGDLHFFPAGEETLVELASPWASPSFGGAFLPAERTLSQQGFEASWKIPFLARGVPQQWVDAQVGSHQIDASLFGVSLFLPADGYQKTERSVKYAVLFILLTSLTFFLIELVSPVRLFAVHYLLVGLALVLFYLLLLALSEHLGFGLSYALAAAGCTGLIAAYSKSLLGSGRWAGLLLACLATLYGYLYVLLQAEDYALLMGAIGLFAILGLVMFLTRRLDWRRLEFRRVARPEGA